MIVKVKQLHKSAWAGVYTFKEDMATKVGVGVDGKTGFLKMPYKTKEEQAEWEEKLGYPKGYLAPNSDFWTSFYVNLFPITEFDTDIPQHAFQLEVLKTRKIIAKDYKEATTNAYAEYVIHDEEQFARNKNIEAKTERKALKLFESLSTEDMKKVLNNLGHKTYGQSSEVIESKLYELVKADPKTFLLVAEDKNLAFKSDLIEAVHYGILKKSQNRYFYGDVDLGKIDEAANILQTTEYAETAKSIILQLNDKRKGK